MVVEVVEVVVVVVVGTVAVAGRLVEVFSL